MTHPTPTPTPTQPAPAADLRDAWELLGRAQANLARASGIIQRILPTSPLGNAAFRAALDVNSLCVQVGDAAGI